MQCVQLLVKWSMEDDEVQKQNSESHGVRELDIRKILPGEDCAINNISDVILWLFKSMAKWF
jgi:hypothetical protein